MVIIGAEQLFTLATRNSNPVSTSGICEGILLGNLVLNRTLEGSVNKNSVAKIPAVKNYYSNKRSSVTRNSSVARASAYVKLLKILTNRF